MIDLARDENGDVGFLDFAALQQYIAERLGACLKPEKRDFQL